MDRIILRGLRFYGRHGVLPSEQEREQPFRIDLELELNLAPAGKSDRLEDTVDYAEVIAVVQNIVEKESVQLLEALAERISAELFKRFAIMAVSVVVEKPEAPIAAEFAAICVKIHRFRE